MKANWSVDTILHHKGSTVWTISPNATVFEAIKLLAEKNIGAVPVLDGEQLVGIFSERDYTRKIALEGKTSTHTKVGDVVSKPVISVTPEHTVEDCMRLMTDKRIRHLPVLRANKIIGIISIGDLVNWIISAQKSAIDQMENYIAGR